MLGVASIEALEVGLHLGVGPQGVLHGELTEADRRKVLGGNAVRFYNLSV